MSLFKYKAKPFTVKKQATNDDDDFDDELLGPIIKKKSNSVNSSNSKINQLVDISINHDDDIIPIALPSQLNKKARTDITTTLNTPMFGNFISNYVFYSLTSLSIDSELEDSKAVIKAQELISKISSQRNALQSTKTSKTSLVENSLEINDANKNNIYLNYSSGINIPSVKVAQKANKSKDNVDLQDVSDILGISSIPTVNRTGYVYS